MFKDKEIHHHHYHIVEVEKGTKLPELTGDLKESLKILPSQPAFNYILQRLRFQKAAMETTLREGINLTEVQLRYLQAGIFWSSQIEKDIHLLTQAPSLQRTAIPDEQVSFETLQRAVELVGQE